ncbi:MAG: DinB family protein [Flavobacteriaceae bacterium]|nr:DinB family protein [Flavobacteriaceae bacterium]
MITELLKVEEYVSYQSMYLDLVEDKPIVVSLEGSLHEFISFFNSIEEAKLSFSYKEGKWTVRELLLHLIDTERIFQYRALRFARNDKTSLPGYDENFYVPNSNANSRDIASLLKEYEAVRNSTIALFNSFNEETMLVIGYSGGDTMSVRAIAYVILGHQIHHINIVKERYLV